MISSLTRAVRTEAVRLGGIRGPLARAAFPLGLVLPIVLTLAIGAVAETLHSDDGLIQVREVGTSNSVYWVVYLGVTVHAVVAAYTQASSAAGPVGELGRHLSGGRFSELAARWIVAGAFGALCSFFATLFLLVALPAFFPGVYGGVDAASPEGVRFLWSVPVYCFAACGIGVGLGALIGATAVAVTALTLWALFIENAVVFLPGGARLVAWMPFANGIFGTGQELAIEPPWGPDGGLAYIAAVAVIFFVLGALRRIWSDRR